MARRTITVKLDEPVQWFNSLIGEIVVKEPTAAQFIEIGDPTIWARSLSGAVFQIEQGDAIKRYMDVCLDVENGGSFLALLPMSEGQKIKGALLGFFSAPAVSRTSEDASAS
jgi:hypothetical protein